MFFMVNKTKQKLLFGNNECFSKKEKKCQELIFAEDTYLAPYGYRYSPYDPGFEHSILKIFVVNADSLFAKYCKLTTS